jgi:hypothetical protein
MVLLAVFIIVLTAIVASLLSQVPFFGAESGTGFDSVNTPPVAGWPK